MANIIITVDAEVGEKSKNDPSGFEKFILGRVEGEEYGVRRIMGICEKNGCQAEFFLDYCGYIKYGEYKYKDIALDITGRGHGLQLHTHPSLLKDPGRAMMSQYSLDEQAQIISEGVRKFSDWCGAKPVAHRAGCYGADDNTLNALAKSGICYDFSCFLGHENCKMSTQSPNLPFRKGGVVEVPVTAFKDRRRYTALGLGVFARSVYTKFDINWLSLAELKYVLGRYEGSDSLLVFFLHSSSFINRLGDGSVNRANPVNERLFHDFDYLLGEMVSKHNIIMIPQVDEGMLSREHPEVTLNTQRAII